MKLEVLAQKYLVPSAENAVTDLLSDYFQGREVAASTKEVIAATTTPWGTSQDQYNLAPGLIWYNTPGHGGLYVSKALADKELSANAREMAIKYKGAYWYEEDCQYAIPLYEKPEWAKLLQQKAGGGERTKEELKQSIERWHPDYFQKQAAEIIDFKHLQRDDLIYLDRDQSPYSFLMMQGDKALISRGGTNYKLSKVSYFNRVKKVEREGKEMTRA